MQTYSIYPKDFKNIAHKLKSNTCFIMMPFSHDKDETYCIIKRALESQNIFCRRSDDVKASPPFIHNIVDAISTSYYLIVDISNLNANVLYELGIAHTLRSASKVLIIKDNNTDCPSDLRHFNYISYDKSKSSELYDNIIGFIKSNNRIDDLEEILSFLNIIENRENITDIMTDVQLNIVNHTSTIINIFNSCFDEIIDEEINSLIKAVYNRIILLHNENKNALGLFYTRLLIQLLNKLVNVVPLIDFVNVCFEKSHTSDDKYILDIKSDIACVFIKLRYNISVFHWIKRYLINSNPAEVDIAKFKLQIGLINSNKEYVEEFLLSNIIEAESDPLVEHSLNLCKEKQMIKSIPMAIHLIEHTDNPYIFRSAIDLIAKLGSKYQIENILKIIRLRENYISMNPLLNPHIESLKGRLISLQQ